ncbi:MAG: type II secretion system protein [Aquificae bacterium]|nr:type II secretion system protein [Aquificota bacterium]
MLLGKAFTLIEALITIVIVTFLALFIMNSVLLFPLMVRKDLINFCLQQAAASGIEYARANPAESNTTLTVECKGMRIEVEINGSVPTGECGDVTATASYGSQSFSLSDKVCNL